MKNNKTKKAILENMIKESVKKGINKHVNKKVNKFEIDLLKKAILFENNEENVENKVNFNKENKQLFLEKVKKFGEFGKILYELNNYKNISRSLQEISSDAENFVLSENQDWFDSLTVKRNIKELKGYVNEFSKTSLEAQKLQERLLVLYEDVGIILDRYFGVGNEDKMPINEGFFGKLAGMTMLVLAPYMSGIAQGQEVGLVSQGNEKPKVVNIDKINNVFKSTGGPEIKVLQNNDSTIVIKVDGIGESKDMQMAIDKAIFDIRVSIDEYIKKLEKETGNKYVQVVGQTKTFQKVIKEGGLYVGMVIQHVTLEKINK